MALKTQTKPQAGWLLLLLLSTLLGCGRQEIPPVASHVPDQRLPTDLGDSLALTDYPQTVRLVAFWATWCAPCLVEIPTFKTLQQELGGQGLQIIAISLDDNAEQVLPKARARFAFNYPLAIGDARIVQAFGNFASLPTAFLVDRSGKIRERLVGLRSYNELNLKIRSLLDEPSPAEPGEKSTSTP